MISPSFVEANYEVLESLLRERQRQIRNKDLRTELEYFSEDCDEEREMEPRPGPTRETTPPLRLRSPRVRRQRERVVGYEESLNKEGSRVGRNAKGSRPSEIETRENENNGMNLPLLLVAHLGRNESGQSLLSSFTSVYGGHQSTTNIGGISLLTILGLHEDKHISGFVHGLRTRSLVEHLPTDLPSTYKGLMEKTYTWIEARERTERQGKVLPPTEDLIMDCFPACPKAQEISLPQKRASKIDSKVPLIGFSREKSWSSAEIPLEITIGDPPLVRRENLNFVIVRSDSPYNMLLGRTTMQKMGIIVSTIHEAIKFHTAKGIRTLFSTYESDKIKEGMKKELTKAGILRKVKHQTWVANPVMVKKSDGGWRMCVDFMNINKACPKDYYPLPKIDWKNVGATYQRLVDKVFHDQIERNLKAYVDDMVIKRTSEEDMLANIKETLESPSKVKAITDIEQPKTLKDIQSLNGKLAALGRFLSKVPKESISAALFSKRKEEQVPIYFVSRVLQGAELNYPGLEKLTLVLALTKPEKSGRVAKWAIQLGEHDIVLLVVGKSNKGYLCSQATNDQRIPAEDQREVLVEVLSKMSIEEKEILQVETKEEESWMTPIYEYLVSELLPEDPKESRKIRVKASTKTSFVGNPQVWQGPHMISEVCEGELYKIIDASDHSLIQTS
ncbi:hypothetical protein Tco_0403559 [Tanacetum coccineum]